MDILGALGKTVLISNFGRHYRLAQYLSRHTHKMHGIALGVPSLARLMEEKYYADLEGGLMESLGRLFKGATRIYVYPVRDAATGQTITVETLQVDPHLRHLYAYLLENEFITGLQNRNPEYLSISPPRVLAKIQSGDASWENDVPPPTVEAIKRGKMFGWKDMI